MTSATTHAWEAQLPPLVAVVGATGTGKSEFALDLVVALSARGHTAAIVNADAMQLYTGMDIGTAKLPPNERRGVPHHLLDIWNVTQEASVAEYQALARATIKDLQSGGVIPLLVGGSGLYVSSVLYDFEFPGTDAALRQHLEERLEVEGREALVRELAEHDPLAAVAIDSRNSRRLIRALEVVKLTGKPFGAGLDAERRRWQENLVLVGLHTERDELVPHLDSRVDRMWESGLVEEARGLMPLGLREGVTASQAIGYQQALSVIDGTASEAEVRESTQALTRRYARRQVSWFRRDASVTWLVSGDENRVATATSLVMAALA